MLELRPCDFQTARDFVGEHHRHNKPPVGHKFSIACYDGDRLCGVAIAGQPVARRLDDGMTIEVRRVCTDGTHNACSALYGACARTAKEMGYARILTYTLATEPGTSLKASGWKDCGECGGGTWDVPSRPREIAQTTLFGTEQKYPVCKKRRWEKRFKEV